MRLFFVLLSLCSNHAFSQGLTSNWLLGYWQSSNSKGRLVFTDTSAFYTQESRAMPFRDTEGNLSDKNGNLLMYSNGIWIANSLGDTMFNGSDLNPNSFTSAWNDGNLIPNGNVFLPMPNDTNIFILIHQTGDSLNNVPSTELYYSKIDIRGDNGLGEVISKNNIIFHDTISWGLGACKHSNGRDWWVVAIKDGSDSAYTILIDTSGISNYTTQQLNIFPVPFGNVTQPTFSPDGKKFAFSYSGGGTIVDHYLYLFDFDRCTGVFSNPHIINLVASDSSIGVGVSFSPNSQFAYVTSYSHVYQINTNTLFVDTVATYDGFSFPVSLATTYFDLMYLAPNGKIYIQTPSSAQHIHEINFPDSSGVACDVQQHSIFLNIWNRRTVPFHPNYYLGCDTTSGCPCLATSLSEIEKQNFNFSISPNPSNGNIKLMYILPQNKSGTFQIFDINGKAVYSQNLPQWSTLQNIDVSFLSPGVYSCQINSNNFLVSKKLVVIR